MKKKKKETHEKPGINKNSKIESGIGGNEENFPGTEFPHLPHDEDMYLNEAETDQNVNPVQNYSYTDIEKKQNENNPLSERSDYPAIPFLVNLNTNITNPFLEIKRDENQEEENRNESDSSIWGNNLHDS